MVKRHIAVFLSGRGSNFLSILKFSRLATANYRVAVVISDRKRATGLERARNEGLPAFHVSPRQFTSKDQYERELIRILKDHEVELIALAGYMRIVGRELLTAYPQRILNIHPALLPSFPGLHAQRQALEHGVKVSGCTVHFVDSGLDTGPIILQEAVAVEEGDDEEALSRRILKQEHRIYPRAIELYFADRLKITGRRVCILDQH